MASTKVSAAQRKIRERFLCGLCERSPGGSFTEWRVPEVIREGVQTYGGTTGLRDRAHCCIDPIARAPPFALALGVQRLDC